MTTPVWAAVQQHMVTIKGQFTQITHETCFCHYSPGSTEQRRYCFVFICSYFDTSVSAAFSQNNELNRFLPVLLQKLKSDTWKTECFQKQLPCCWNSSTYWEFAFGLFLLYQKLLRCQCFVRCRPCWGSWWRWSLSQLSLGDGGTPRAGRLSRAHVGFNKW